MRGGSNPPRTSRRNRTAGLSLRKQGCPITATGMPTRTTAGRGRNGSRRCPVQPGRFAAGCSSQVAEPAHNRKVESSNLSPATNLGVAPDAWRFHQFPPGTRATPPKVPRVASAKGSRAPETEARCCPGSRERSGAFFFPRPRGRREKIFAPQLPVAEPIAESAEKIYKFHLHARALATTLPIVEEPRLPRHGKKGDHVEPNWICAPSRWDFCGLPGPGRLPCRLRGGLRAPNSEELR